MSDVPPSPPPAQTPGIPPQLPPPVNMAPRWIAWTIASVILPALPWLLYSEKARDAGTAVVVMTIFALILQLAASAAVSIGFCRKRFIGVGGMIGMTLIFMVPSVIIGTTMWFTGCLARMSLDYR
jgi:hypothetical protein